MSTPRPNSTLDAAVQAALNGRPGQDDNPAAKMPIVLTIGFDPRTGQVAFHASGGDHFLLCGMLSQAQRLVYQMQDAAEAKAKALRAGGAGGPRLVVPV